MKKSVLALQKFPSVNCAQSVFSSFSEELKLNEKTCLRIASGFGSGMTQAETCGAVTGSYMVIGMKHGHDSSEQEGKEKTKKLIREFNAAFLSEHGSLKCKNLVGYDISKPDELEKARESGVFLNICPRLIASACDILEEKF